jgi:hypothetical protein
VLLEKAFDSVWHESLLHEMVVSNFYLYLTKIIASFLHDCSFHVRVDITNSTTLAKKLTFASHTAKSIEKSEKAFRIVYSSLNRKSRLNSHNKLLLYKTSIRSILGYGVETWFPCANTQKKKLQIIQNKRLKIIMNRHWRYSPRFTRKPMSQ